MAAISDDHIGVETQQRLSTAELFEKLEEILKNFSIPHDYLKALRSSTEKLETALKEKYDEINRLRLEVCFYDW